MLAAPLMAGNRRLRAHHLIQVQQPEAAFGVFLQFIFNLRYVLFDLLLLSSIDHFGYPHLLLPNLVLFIDL